MFHPIEEALEALKKGEVIIVVDDEDRENEGAKLRPCMQRLILLKHYSLWIV